MEIYWWAAIATIAGVAYPFVRKGLRIMFRFYRVFKRAVYSAEAELNQNGGSSLKDSVDGLVKGQERIERWMAGHDGLHKGLEQRGWAD